jgi:hypothetical protein
MLRGPAQMTTEALVICAAAMIPVVGIIIAVWLIRK